MSNLRWWAATTFPGRTATLICTPWRDGFQNESPSRSQIRPSTRTQSSKSYSKGSKQSYKKPKVNFHSMLMFLLGVQWHWLVLFSTYYSKPLNTELVRYADKSLPFGLRRVQISYDVWIPNSKSLNLNALCHKPNAITIAFRLIAQISVWKLNGRKFGFRRNSEFGRCLYT